MTEATLLKLDPRLKILLAVLLGLLTWSSGPAGLVAYLLGLCLLCWRLRAALPGQRHVLKSYGWFLLLWTAAKFGVDVWAAVPVGQATLAAGLLALRLTCLLLTGLVLAMSASPRQLGMALTWFLRPVMGRRSWKAALALALMVHFLPLTWLALAQARTIISLRCPDMGFFRRTLLTAQAVLRALGQKTWNQALAVGCRRLDAPGAWRPVFSSGAMQWIGFAVCAAALWSLSLV